MVDDTALERLEVRLAAASTVADAVGALIQDLAATIRENAAHPGAVLQLADELDARAHAVTTAAVTGKDEN